MIDVKEVAAGRWRNILVMMGIAEKYFNGKHQACPICKAGKDRFRWNKKTEWGHCNACGSMSAVDMAIQFTGLTFKELANEVKGEYLRGKIVADNNNSGNEKDKNLARLKKVHSTLILPSKGEAVVKYLASRGISVAPEQDLYESDGVAYFDSEGKKLGVYKAMVAAFRDINNKLISYHVTYLEEGKKATVDCPKKIFPPVAPLKGSAIRLFKPENGILGIAEGIETAIAAHELDGVAVWASGNAYLMESFVCPDDIKQLNVYCDQDSSFTGQQAAYSLAKRVSSKGINVKVNFPNLENKWIVDDGLKYDFLDLLVLKNYQNKPQKAA